VRWEHLALLDQSELDETPRVLPYGSRGNIVKLSGDVGVTEPCSGLASQDSEHLHFMA